MELRKIKKDKRGDVTDIIVFLLIVFFLAITFVVTLLVNAQIRNVISDTALNNTSAASSILDSFDNINSVVVQRGFVLFISLLIVGVLVSSFLVRIHPAFVFLYIFILAFTIFIAVYLGNIYEDFTAIETIAEIAEQQTMINFVMSNIVKIVLAVGALSMIVVFSKIFSSSGGGTGTDTI